MVGRKKLLEDKIISLVVKDQENLKLIEDQHRNLFCEKMKNFIDELNQNKAMLADISKKEEYKDFFNTLALRAEVDYQEDGPDEVQLCLSELKNIYIRERRLKTSEAIKEAEKAKDFGKVDVLMQEFNRIN